MPPVIAIGIDAGDPHLLDEWIEAGDLPHLRRLRRTGAFGQLRNLHYYRAETAWTTFLTGVSPERSGYWTPLRYSEDYSVQNVGAYDFAEYPPFYALGDRYRVAVVDLPQTRLVEGVNGVQLVAWGAHSALAPSGSRPGQLIGELTARHGLHPALGHDEASIYDGAALRRLRDDLLTGIRRRTALTLDLLARERWDLFLTMYGETHGAGHYLWHLSRPDHPLYRYLHEAGHDPLLDVMKAVDEGIGAIVAASPPGSTLIVYSGHGMEANSMDLPSMVFLPELLFRYSFPGRRGLSGASAEEPIPPPRRALSRTGWEDELYALKHDTNPITRTLRRRLPARLWHRIERKLGLNTPPVCYLGCSTLHYQPAWWYRSAWPEMKAFALPSFSEGYVRINVAGREARGLVNESDYDAVCHALARELLDLRDGRSGAPLVREVVRTRQHPFDTARSVPQPDLIVSWAPLVTDVADSPALGRIGPVPFLRSGSHVERGFLIAAGPGIDAGSELPPGHSLDLAPTFLTLIGAPLPPHFEGRPLVQAAGLRVPAVS